MTSYGILTRDVMFEQGSKWSDRVGSLISWVESILAERRASAKPLWHEWGWCVWGVAAGTEWTKRVGEIRSEW